MKTKTKALALLSMVVVAAVAGVIIFTVEPAVKADTTDAVASDIESTTLSAVNATDNAKFGFNAFIGGAMTIREGFCGSHGGMGREFGGFGYNAIQVSSDFAA
ncbi:MAG: hypothetical protein ACM3UN_05765, partial [Bacillota bacterium]